MRFPKGQTPPVQGFWSLTMYDSQYFFVANPLNRYSISPRQNLKANPDGSIDLLYPERLPGHGQGIELASRAGREVHPDAAHVLAGRNRTLDHRRDMDNPAGEEGVIGARTDRA
jgi:hypothetical protein